MSAAHLSVVPAASAPVSGVAPLRNISALSALITKTQQRASHLPGMATFSGPSGFGKSFAAAYAAGQHRAYYVEARSGCAAGRTYCPHSTMSMRMSSCCSARWSVPSCCAPFPGMSR